MPISYAMGETVNLLKEDGLDDPRLHTAPLYTWGTRLWEFQLDNQLSGKVVTEEEVEMAISR